MAVGTQACKKIFFHLGASTTANLPTSMFVDLFSVLGDI